MRKKAELARLKDQLEDNDHRASAMETDYSSNKRARERMSDADTSGDEDVDLDTLPTTTTTQSRSRIGDNSQGSSLDLGNDRIDYKPSTVPKQHQRRKPATTTRTISTRSMVRHASRAGTVATPSLPDDSQTTDDLLNKI